MIHPSASFALAALRETRFGSDFFPILFIFIFFFLYTDIPIPVSTFSRLRRRQETDTASSFAQEPETIPRSHDWKFFKKKPCRSLEPTYFSSIDLDICKLTENYIQIAVYFYTLGCFFFFFSFLY